MSPPAAATGYRGSRARTAREIAGDASDPDVLVPELRVRRDELRHETDAPVVLEHVDGHASRAQQLFLARERAILADDHARDPVEENGAGAHRARRERRIDRALPVHDGRLAPRRLERVHLAVQHGAATLHAAVVPAPADAAVVHEHRADRDASLAQTALGFGDRGAHELVSHVAGLRHGADSRHAMMTNHSIPVAAAVDETLTAVVVTQTALYYVEGADASVDRPAHVRAGSG